MLRSFILTILALALAYGPVVAQVHAKNSAASNSKQITLVSREGHFEIRYPPSLIRCERRDGENPDVWSPERGCAAPMPVCDNSGHSGEVLACLAYSLEKFRGSELQGAALSVSRLDGYSTANECAKRWPSSGTRDAHTERIGALSFQSASAVESETSHMAERDLYRVFHRASCYEIDVTLTIALPSAFAAEDTPTKLTKEQRNAIKSSLFNSLQGFRFVK